MSDSPWSAPKKKEELKKPNKPVGVMQTTLLLLLAFVAYGFISENITTKPCQELHYKDKVKIVKGFYKGQQGTVINAQEKCVFNVEIKGIDRLRDIAGEDLELIKEVTK